MREIKFRAFDNWQFKYFDLDALEDRNVSISDENFNSVTNCVINQYTWLKDKNWKEIYEGDIVKRYKDMFNPFYRTMVVRYDTMFPEFRLYKISNQAVSGIETIWEHFYWEHNNPNNLEVIWNIYEDKNLLTNK